jgi:hypothetical protein
MSADRVVLADLIERHYRSQGWPVERLADGTVRARGIGGVPWIGLPVVAADLEDEGFEARLRALGEERTPEGRLCPLELLPDPDCRDDLKAVLRRLDLHDRGHIDVYSVA